MELLATTVGLFPLPDAQRDRLADLKGHQKSDLIDGNEAPAVRDAYAATRRHNVERQREAGLDRLVEGHARWDDLLAHPLCVHENTRTEGIVRYYDNNNFYREPVVEGPLTADGDVPGELNAAAELAGNDALQAILPGPYSLADLATDEHYGSHEEFLAAVADFLAGEIAAFPDAVEALAFLEPSLVEEPPAVGEGERVRDAIDTVAAATDAEVLVHPYWGVPNETLYGHLLDSDADALGYDLVTAEAAATNLVTEHGAPDRVSIGVVDGQNTLVEDPDDVRERAQRFGERAGSETVALTPNTGLFHLPVNKFEAKLDTLAAAAGGAR